MTELAAWLVSHRFTATVLLTAAFGLVLWIGCAVAFVLWAQEGGEW